MQDKDTKRTSLYRIPVGDRDQVQLDESSIVKTQRVFVNRNLKMRNVRVIGFDLDHTLAVYNKIPIEALAFDETKKKLVGDKRYPRDLLRLNYDPEFGIRGLVVDKIRGNTIKMDKHKYVVTVYHGRRPMSRSDRKVTYVNKRLTLYDREYRPIDTLFSLPAPYQQIFDDIRECIDEAHRDGSIKSRVQACLSKYFLKDPKLPLTLDKFIKGGKKLFLLTNSGWEYTDKVLGYLLNGELADYPDWKDYFDLVVIDAGKPGYFAAGSALEAVEGNGGDEGNHRRRIYRRGNAKQTEELLGACGEEILYFGDHTHADILKSKKTSGWRTAMIIEELEREIVSAEKVRRLSEELERLYEAISDLRLQSNLLAEKVALLKDTKSQDYNSLTTLELARIDKEIESYLRRGIRVEQKITDQLTRTKELEAEIEKAFNPYWGQLCKAGRENSRFGDQVEDFACVYASRVSNFLHYPVNKYYQTRRELMPHET
ncbi:MAG: HAD-IG family 5'-nucleotidase [Candidatus Riflebacteria bacterium]|nr:HAD-IG family 5'-nucleotidase [Candidatus Riflebacteria bacterium]